MFPPPHAFEKLVGRFWFRRVAVFTRIDKGSRLRRDCVFNAPVIVRAAEESIGGMKARNRRSD
jgi:hypothetical protein